MMIEEFGDIANYFSSEALMTTLGKFEQLFSKDDKLRKRVTDWKMLKDYHVTCEFLGRDAYAVEDSKIYPHFKEGRRINVDVLALVVVPGKLAIGICFPED